MKDFGELRYFLEMEFARSYKRNPNESKEICIRVNFRMWFRGRKATTTPLEQNQKLTSLEYDKVFESPSDDAKLEDRKVYQKTHREVVIFGND